MNHIKKISLINLFCSCIIFASSIVFSGDILYRNKPSWWDRVNVKIIPGKNYYDTYRKTFEQLDYQGEKIETWAVLGPLENNKNKPFEKIYGPEQTLKYNRKEEFKGVKGESVTWQSWRKDKKCPIPANVTNCVIFFYSVYKSPKEGKQFLVFASDDGAEIWINKEKVFENHNKRNLDSANPDIIEVELEKGNNDIWIKLSQQSSSWGISLQITSHDPAEVRLKALIELFNKGNFSDKEKADLSHQIQDAFIKMNDIPNYLFWFNEEMLDMQKISKRRVSEPMERLKDVEGSYEYIISYFSDVFSNPKIDKDKRIFCADYIIDQSFDKNDFKTLEKFFNIYQNQLKAIMPRSYLVAQIKVQVMKGDFDEASKLTDELKAECKNKKELQRFGKLFQIVNGMKSSSMQMPIDYDLTNIKAEISKFSNEKKSNIDRFIRMTLSQKALLVTQNEGEKDLFSGMLSTYKGLFEPFNNDYAPDLKTYLTVLKEAGDIDNTDLMQKEALLSLEPVKFPEYRKKLLVDLKSIALPADKAQPYPYLNMHQGTPEFHAEIDFIDKRLKKRPPASACAENSTIIFQNYHEVVCLENDKIKWRYISPNSIPLSYTEQEIKAKIFFEPVYPIIENGMVFARLFKNGLITLFCFDAANGKIKWVLPDNKLEVCSGVGIWRDRLIMLAKENDTLSRYFLIELNRANGKITRKTFLFAAENSFHFNRKYNIARVQGDLFMPAPLILGDQAYVSTNQGVVISYDIMSGSFNWLRKYNETQFPSNEKSAANLANRRTSSPIAGKSGVLFKPLNSASLILLDQKTGKLTASLIVDWRETIPCGDKYFLLIDNQGDATFYNIDDLKKEESLPGKDYRFVQQLNDGVILQTKNKLVIYDFYGKLKKSFTLPDNTVAIFANQNSLFAYNNNNKDRSTIEKFLLKKPDTVLNINPDDNLKEMFEVEFMTIGNDLYLLSRDTVIKLKPDGTPLWSISTPQSESKRVYQNGDYTYIFNQKQVFCVNKKTGLILNSFPEYNHPIYPVTCETIYSKDVVFFNEDNWNITIFKMNSENIENIGKYSGAPISSFENGALIADWKKRSLEIRFLRKDPQKGSFTTETASYNFKPEFSKPYSRRFVNDQLTLLRNSNELVLIDSSKKVKEFKLAKGKKPIPAWEDPGFRDLFIYGDYCVFKNYYDLANVFDLKKKKDISQVPKFSSIPIYVDKMFFGISEKDIVCFDPATEKIVYKNNLDKLTKGKSSVLTSKFELNNKAAFYYQTAAHYNNKRSSEEGFIMLFSKDSPEPETFHFPSAETGSSFLDTGEALLITLPEERRIIRLSKQEFETLKEKSPNLAVSKNEPIQCTIDGYADEWDLSKFHKINKNRFDARIIDGKYLVLAIELNDPAAIEQLGTPGFDDRYKLVIVPGPVASLQFRNVRRVGKENAVGLYSKLQSEKEQGTTVEYSVKPDGSSCFIEIKVPLDKILYYSLSLHKKNSAREFRGDFAFDILYSDELGIKHAVLTGKEIPAFFPRIFFSDLDIK